MEYAATLTPLSGKLALVAPPLTVPDVTGDPTTLFDPSLTVKVTVPSLPVAVDGLFDATAADSVTLESAYCAVGFADTVVVVFAAVILNAGLAADVNPLLVA